MGVPRLTGLIQSEPSQFFKSIKLHDTFLVIDGNCISCWIYRLSCRRSPLNGDYNEFERAVQHFFTVLKECNIFPIVILDGAHEERKFKRTKERMEERILLNEQINSIDFKGDVFTPALLTEVFKDTMADMNILYCQSFLEADLDTTKVAQFLNCPVLSFDSDFYLDDVDYIPFSTLNLDLLELKENKEGSNSKYFIFGKLFNRENFLGRFGDLPNVSFLPLLSFLLGNDYSETEIYESFFSRLNNKRDRPNLKQKISMICKWFRNFTSPEMAAENFLEQIPTKSRQRTRKELLRCLMEKNCNEHNYLVQYLQHSLLSKTWAAVLPSTLISKIKVIEESSKWLQNAVCFISPTETDTSKKTTMHVGTNSLIPEWILSKYVQGELPRNLMDLFLSKRFFFAIQMEVHSLPSVSIRTVEILQSVIGLVYYHHPMKDNVRIIVHSRKGNRLGNNCLAPVFLNASPNLAELPNKTLLDREKLAFDVLKIEQTHGTVVPDNWKLFFLSVADWYRADKSQIMTHALGCIIFSSIFVGIIDKNLGYYDNELLFLEKFSESGKKVNNEKQIQAGNSATSLPTENFQSAIDNIDEKDCIIALKKFLLLRDGSVSELFSSKKLFKPILHRFAQLQVNFMTIEILNAILYFPFKSLKIADFYCGTLAYNIYFKIKKYANLESFVLSEFKHMPTLQTLFLSAIKVIEKLSKCKLLTNKLQKEKTKQNRQKKNNVGHNKKINLPKLTSQIPRDNKIPPSA